MCPAPGAEQRHFKSAVYWQRSDTTFSVLPARQYDRTPQTNTGYKRNRGHKALQGAYLSLVEYAAESRSVHRAVLQGNGSVYRLCRENRISDVGKRNTCRLQRVFSKLPGKTLRMAGLLHLCEHSPSECISGETMSAAIEISKYYGQHYLKMMCAESYNDTPQLVLEK